MGNTSSCAESWRGSSSKDSSTEFSSRRSPTSAAAVVNWGRRADFLGMLKVDAEFRTVCTDFLTREGGTACVSLDARGFGLTAREFLEAAAGFLAFPFPFNAARA